MTDWRREKISDFIYNWSATYGWDAEDEISGIIADTNAIFNDFEISDEIEIIDLEEADNFSIFYFRFDAALYASPAHEDRFIGWVRTIYFTVVGRISFDSNDGECDIIDFSIDNISTNQDDDDENESFSSTAEEEGNISALLISQPRFTNADDLFSKILRNSKKLWWRGHGDASWKLQTSISRQDNPHLSLENELRLAFENRTTFLDPASHPLGVAKSTFMMQHHGLPTRLLDWTTSPLAALYFAVWESVNDSKDACLWALDPGFLNKTQSTSYPFIIDEQDVDRLFLDPSVKLNVAIHAPYTDLRMKVQQSEFTLHTHYEGLEEQLDAQLFLEEKLVISSAIKSEIKDRLRKLGVTRETLFPDLDNIAKSIGEEIL